MSRATRLFWAGLLAALAGCGHYYRVGGGPSVRDDRTVGAEVTASAGLSVGGMGMFGVQATGAIGEDGDARMILGIEVGFGIAPATLANEQEYRDRTRDETRARLFGGFGGALSDDEARASFAVGLGVDRMQVKHLRHRRKSFSTGEKSGWGFDIDDWRAAGFGLEVLYRTDQVHGEFAARAVYWRERRRN